MPAHQAVCLGLPARARFSLPQIHVYIHVCMQVCPTVSRVTEFAGYSPQIVKVVPKEMCEGSHRCAMRNGIGKGRASESADGVVHAIFRAACVTFAATADPNMWGLTWSMGQNGPRNHDPGRLSCCCSRSAARSNLSRRAKLRRNLYRSRASWLSSRACAVQRLLRGAP